MRPETSSAGRFQFSDENAKTVKYAMPRCAHARTVRTRASTPDLCPKARGISRWLAQRPLPSITMATWRGSASPELTGAAKVGDSVEVTGRVPSSSAASTSNSHDLGFLGHHQLVDLCDRAVSQLLHVFLR